MPNYSQYEERVKNTYKKEAEKPSYTCEECTCKFIKPRTGYDEMIKAGKFINLPNLDSNKINKWK